MNLLTRALTAVDRFHYRLIQDEVDLLHDTCSNLRGIGMAGSPAFRSVADTIEVHRRELWRTADRLRARGVPPIKYPMGRLETSLWAVALVVLSGWVLATLFGPAS